MMAKLMRWRPWPPVITKKFKVNLKVQSLEGLDGVSTNRSGEDDVMMTIMIKVEWRGPKGALGYHFGRSQKRARTREKGLEEGCSVNWQEDFEHLCVLAMAKHTGRILPFYVHFSVIQLGTKSRSTILGTATMNLVDFSPSTQAETMEHTTRLNVSNLEGLQKQVATLVVTVSFTEVLPIENLSLECSERPSLLSLNSAFLCDQKIRRMYEKKVKYIRKTVSFNWKKTSGELDIFTCNGKLFPTSEECCREAEESSVVTDSMDGSEDVRTVDEGNQLLQSYGSLTGVNLVVEGALSSLIETKQEPPVVSTCKAPRVDNTNEASTSGPDSSTHMRNLLSWKKRKFRARPDRGEPLLRKAHSEGGGDDIDHYRRLSLNYLHGESQEGDSSAMLSSAALSKYLDCGEVQFSVGCWEKKEFVNRVGHMKLSTKVFFASIDQRSERAAGESACTALVVVIADWLHKNSDRMPIRAELDTLIRQGSAEWRRLCDVEMYRQRFPDRHFDLDTVLEAKVRPVGILEGGTSVGFFKPEEENKMFEFLHDTVPFDDIWESSIIEESSVSKSDGSFKPAVYVVSWNDHFFLLKVDRDAYYIIDTLGERLYEGCKQAYILCFDKETSLSHQVKSDKMLDGKKSPIKTPPSLPSSSRTGSLVPAASTSTQPPDKITGTSDRQQHGTAQGDDDIDPQAGDSNRVEYTGRDACKQFIKGFFAALPLKQLHMDMKKGLLGTSPPHQRLQIEFHRTYSCHIASSPLVEETNLTLQHSSPSLVEETNPTRQHASPLEVEVNRYSLRRSTTS